MHPDLRRRMPLVRAAALLATLLTQGRCAAPPAVPKPARPFVVRIAPPPTASAAAIASDDNGRPVLFNDPSAPPDTPLCGRQAREANADAAALQDGMAASGVCAAFACYDPLTATYVGADGYRHVCR